LSTRTSRETKSSRILAVLTLLKALLLTLSLWSTLPAVAVPISRDDPESTDPDRKNISTASGSAVVVTANPLASRAALAALNDGGSAIDALVTAQAVLAVVEPQSSGLAGGGFLLHWDAKQRQLAALDGREVASERSRPGDLLDASGNPIPWRQATSQANAIGIPGTVALLWEGPSKPRPAALGTNPATGDPPCQRWLPAEPTAVALHSPGPAFWRGPQP
jgi:hypothetical protein